MMNALARSKVWIDPQNGLQQALPGFIKGHRWFGGKTRTIRSVEIVDVIPIPLSTVAAAILLARLHYADGLGETYTLPLIAESEPGKPPADSTGIHIRDAESELVVFDGLSNRQFLESLLGAIGEGRRFPARSGELVAIPTGWFEPLRTLAQGALEPSLMRAEQSNSSVLYGRAFVMKFFRHLEPGVNPDFEVSHFLSERAGFPNVPPVAGTLDYRSPAGDPTTVAILQGFVANQGDAWEHTLKALADYYDRVLGAGVGSSKLLGTDWAEVRRLGRRTAELHRALSSDRVDPAFAPEPGTLRYQREVSDTMIGLTRETFEMLRRRASDCQGDLRQRVDALIGSEKELRERFRSLGERKLTGLRMRIHGDLHLGQVLVTGDDFVFIDFEGEPARASGERREKHSPLRDVAGMIRSFHYAAYTALFRGARDTGSPELAPLVRSANAWYRAASDEYLSAYLRTASGGDFLPSSSDEIELVLNFWALGKAVYELKYELNHRLDWVAIPIEGIEMLLRGSASS